jgi:uncharacterized protein YndB with AHSA1/START domain
VQTWRPEWDGSATTTLSYTLEPTSGGTRLVVRHDGFADRHESCRSHGIGWQHVLSWLTSFIEAPVQPAAASVFLCRLIAPRPMFALDMNDAERALMQEHFGYWTEQMNAGKVIVFGPVADPQGPWGLGLVHARDLADIQAFGAADPAIKSERGFRYEFLPMINTILPQ